MNKQKKIWIIVCVCVLVAATVGVGLYIRGAQLQKEKEGAITLKADGKTVTVALKDLNRAAFEGETVNGKGDRSTHAYRGVELKDLLESNGVRTADISAVTAESADQYVAELTGDEVRESGRVYVTVEVDGQGVAGIEEGSAGAQMVVFGDPNSRRNVRFLSIIEVK